MWNRITTTLLVIPIFGLVLGFAACGGHERVGVYVRTPPPPPITETVVVSPGPEYVWIAGYHSWNGSEYSWVPGRWERRPAGRREWVAGRWNHNHHGWFWVEGHWR